MMDPHWLVKFLVVNLKWLSKEQLNTLIVECEYEWRERYDEPLQYPEKF